MDENVGVQPYTFPFPSQDSPKIPGKEFEPSGLIGVYTYAGIWNLSRIQSTVLQIKLLQKEKGQAQNERKMCNVIKRIFRMKNAETIEGRKINTVNGVQFFLLLNKSLRKSQWINISVRCLTQITSHWDFYNDSTGMRLKRCHLFIYSYKTIAIALQTQENKPHKLKHWD